MKLWPFIVTAALGVAQTPPADTLRIYVIDVEGGGATLVVAPSGQSMLIDRGGGPQMGRREFLVETSRSAIGFALVPAFLRAQTSAGVPDAARLIADLENEIP